MESGKKARCVTPKCGRVEQCRGLCTTCCTQARSLVNSGAVTWSKLEELGLSLPKKSVRSPFMIAFNEKTKTPSKRKRNSQTIPIRKHA